MIIEHLSASDKLVKDALADLKSICGDGFPPVSQSVVSRILLFIMVAFLKDNSDILHQIIAKGALERLSLLAKQTHDPTIQVFSP